MARLLSAKRFLSSVSFLSSSSSSSSIKCCYTTTNTTTTTSQHSSIKSFPLFSPHPPVSQQLIRSFTSSTSSPQVFRHVLPGCDFKHWFILMHHPLDDLTRDEIISSYVKTLATVVGSEEKARMKIYSVSTRYYYAFGAKIPEKTALKMKGLKNVRLVLPDSYMNVPTKDYRGEPFINGQPVPYDPKYHEVYLEKRERAKRFLMQQNPGLTFMGGGLPGMTGAPVESQIDDIKKKPKASEPAKKKRHTPVFLVFMEDFRRTYKEEHPENKSVVEVAKEGSKKWKTLTNEEKHQYFVRAAKKEGYSLNRGEKEEVKTDEEGDILEVKAETV